MQRSKKTMEKIVALAKNRGFVFPGSEIYGGLANTWDYGPLGVEFKNNVKQAWWRKFVTECRYNVGLDVYKRQAFTNTSPSRIPLSASACSTCGVMFLYPRRVGKFISNTLR